MLVVYFGRKEIVKIIKLILKSLSWDYVSVDIVYMSRNISNDAKKLFGSN